MNPVTKAENQGACGSWRIHNKHRRRTDRQTTTDTSEFLPIRVRATRFEVSRRIRFGENFANRSGMGNAESSRNPTRFFSRLLSNEELAPRWLLVPLSSPLSSSRTKRPKPRAILNLGAFTEMWCSIFSTVTRYALIRRGETLALLISNSNQIFAGPSKPKLILASLCAAPVILAGLRTAISLLKHCVK